MYGVLNIKVLFKVMNLIEIAYKYGDNNEVTVLNCIQISESGKCREIYIVDKLNKCLGNLHRDMVMDYCTYSIRSKQSHNVKGRLQIKSVNTVRDGKLMSTDNIMEVNEIVNLPVYELK